MPSFDHEIIVELFRRRPALAAELLDAVAHVAAPGERAEVGSADLSQIAPAAYHADVVIVHRDGDGAVAGATIVEVQLAADPDKRYSWPLYLTAARANLRCPVALLVITPDETARWARQPIALGHPGLVLHPLVIALQDVPRISLPEEARAAPELAVLSALAHHDEDVVRAAFAGILELPEELQKLYLDVIISAAPLVRRQLEAMMLKKYEYRSDFARKYFGEGRDEGRRDALKGVIEGRFGALTEEQAARIAAGTPAEIDGWLARVIAAESIADLLA